MSTIFTVSKFPYDDSTALVSDGTNQTGFYVKPGWKTMDDFLAANDVTHWTEHQLDIFDMPMFKDVTGEKIGTFEVPATT